MATLHGIELASFLTVFFKVLIHNGSSLSKTNYFLIFINSYPSWVFCLVTYVCLMQKIRGVPLNTKVKTDGSAVGGSSCGDICNAYVFITSSITCIFTGCVGSSEASIWPGSIGEVNYFYCISWRFDLITYIHTATQLLQLGWVTSNAIEYLLEKQFNL